jgi:hypothetical protein
MHAALCGRVFLNDGDIGVLHESHAIINSDTIGFLNKRVLMSNQNEVRCSRMRKKWLRGKLDRAPTMLPAGRQTIDAEVLLRSTD